MDDASYAAIGERPPMYVAGWQVVVVDPGGHTHEGGIVLYGKLDVTPKHIADQLADIVWRIAIDVAADVCEKT